MLSANALVFAAPQKTMKSEPQSSMFMHESAHETVNKLSSNSLPMYDDVLIENELRTDVEVTLNFSHELPVTRKA